MKNLGTKGKVTTILLEDSDIPKIPMNLEMPILEAQIKKNNQPERSKREDSNYHSIDEWLESPESKQVRVEIGSATGVCFITSEGVKKISPGKSYDINLNEI